MFKKASFLFLFLLTVQANAQEQFSIYFDSNKHELKKSEQGRLYNWMTENTDSKIVAINGYTDEDGSTGFNDTLAQKRVNYVFDFITGRVPIRQDFKTRSFGELHKLSDNKAENRKVTIYYILNKDLARENEILGIKEDPKKPEPKPVNEYPDKIVVQNPNGTTMEVILDKEFMKKVGEAKAGEHLKIDNLNFYENTFAILPESRPKLYELLEIMNLHPGLKIKLQGHICCRAGDPNKLSYQRAKAVFMFLLQNGIPKSRLSFEGLGTTSPIYPLPEKNEEERAANRRVEILVVENK